MLKKHREARSTRPLQFSARWQNVKLVFPSQEAKVQ